jgi:hypothetical protein
MLRHSPSWVAPRSSRTWHARARFFVCANRLAISQAAHSSSSFTRSPKASPNTTPPKKGQQAADTPSPIGTTKSPTTAARIRLRAELKPKLRQRFLTKTGRRPRSRNSKNLYPPRPQRFAKAVKFDPTLSHQYIFKARLKGCCDLDCYRGLDEDAWKESLQRLHQGRSEKEVDFFVATYLRNNHKLSSHGTFVPSFFIGSKKVCGIAWRAWHGVSPGKY